MNSEETPNNPDKNDAETSAVQPAPDNASPPATGEMSPPPGEPSSTNGLCEDKVREQLKKVIDPELFVNIVDLGLIYTVDLTPGEDGKTDVLVEMTMTSPMCPAGPQLKLLRCFNPG